MQDSYFDQLIRTKLQSYEVPQGSSDWDALAERLDADFDAALAEKLVTAAVAYDPGDWNMMEDKLAQPMDAAIREKLEGYEVPFVAADWEAMEAAMPHPFDMAVQAKLTGLSFAAFDADANWDAMGAQLDADFDANIRAHMAQVNPTPEAGDWEAMASLLHAEKPVAWYQRFAPAADVVILLLLAMLWWGGNEKPQADLVQAFEAQTSPPSIDNTQKPNSADSHKESKESVSIVGDHTQLNATDTPASAENTENASRKSTPFTLSSTLAKVPAVKSDQGVSQRLKSTGKNEKQGEFMITAKRSDDVHASGKAVCELVDPDSFTETTQISLSPIALTVETAEKGIALPSIRYGATASVFTSAAEFNDKGLQGYLAGFRVELPISEKISIISGLQYGEKHFDRMQLNVAFANTSLNRQATYWMSRLKGNIQLLEIPILLRYRFSTNNKVNFYFQGGFSPVITLNEEYLHYDPRSAGNVLQTQTRSDIDFTNGQDNPALEAYLNSLQPNVDVHRLNTYAGFLQVAPGVEVKLASQLSLQAEPYIQLGLQRIGSERQSIHSLGATLSLMYHLK